MSLFLSFLGVSLLAHSAQASLPLNYQSLSYQEKFKILERNIVQSPITRDTSGAGPFDMLNLFNERFLLESFTHESDELPRNRKKLIHTHGATAPIEFVITNSNHPYTGLFKTGGIGFVRFSLATMDLEEFTPGLALKIMVSGQPSANVQAMFSLDGQGKDQNFFTNTFTNLIAPPTNGGFLKNKMLKAFQATIALLKSMGSTIDHERHIPLTDMASVTPDGQVVANPVAPEEIFFMPDRAVKTSLYNQIVMDQSRLGHALDFRHYLSTVLPNTRIYKILVRKKGEYQTLEIGELTITGSIIATRYQDEVLFFQHPERN